MDRYKVKSAFYNSMNSDYKQILFNKKLIDDGSVELKIYQLGTLDSFSENLKSCIADVFKSLKNLNFKQEIILKPMDKDDFKSLNKALQHNIKESDKTKAERERIESMRDEINEAVENNTYCDDDNAEIVRCNSCDTEISTYTDGFGVIRCHSCDSFIFDTNSNNKN